LEERLFQFDLRAEVEKFFDDSSVRAGGEPKLVVLTGATCSGKTFVRKRDYSKGYVVVDAAEVFLNLCAGERYEFGTIFGELVDGIGYYVALRAMRERRNIVTEMTVTRPEEVEAVCEAAVSVGYKVEVLFVRCSLEDAQSRFLSRGGDEISAGQTQPYHHRWFTVAAARLTGGAQA
jgi:predicted kinase